MASNQQITSLLTLAKTSIDSTYDYLEVQNINTGDAKRILTSGLFPTLATTGTSSENLYVSVTNKNQLNFKGIKSGDTGLLTVTTASNNIVLTALEAGIDLSLCNNVTSGFLTSVDFTGSITGQNSVINGGTGLSTIAKGAVLYADVEDSIAATSAMSTNGQLLIGNATTGLPTVATLTAGTNITITNTAGAISIASSLTTLAADLDCDNNDIDLGTGYLSADGAQNGVRITGNNAYIGASGQYFNDDNLNLGAGGIRFSNTVTPTIKPNATTSSTAGQALTIESGSSAAGNVGNLNLTAGTASGNATGGSVVVTAGRDTDGSSDGTIQLKTYTGGSAVAGLTVGAEGQNVTVNTGNLVITDSLKGIIHTGSLTVTQATNHGTGVTINATSGVITLAGVALNAAAEADFAVTNSTVQADSVILLTVQCPAATNATDNATLVAQLDEVNSGSFNVRLSNPGAGNVSTNAHKLHFLVINNS